MPLPKAVIVGRPNVGKSSLFNWLAGRRISIVDPTAGVTRDRVTTVMQVGDRFCELVDTGGWDPRASGLGASITRQAEHAMRTADVILFVVDSSVGATDTDLDKGAVVERIVELARSAVAAGDRS